MSNEMKELKEKCFVYLDELRESGVVNMYGATPYIIKEFDIPRSEAINLLTAWMDTFEERHPDI